MNQTYSLQNSYMYIPSETCFHENLDSIRNLSVEDNEMIQLHSFLVCLSLMYLTFPFIALLTYSVWHKLSKLNIIQELKEEVIEDVNRITSYFKSPPTSNLSEIDKILLEMKNFVNEIDTIKYQNVSNSAKMINFKKLYIKTNILTNKYKLKVYERFLNDKIYQ